MSNKKKIIIVISIISIMILCFSISTFAVNLEAGTVIVMNNEINLDSYPGTDNNIVFRSGQNANVTYIIMRKTSSNYSPALAYLNNSNSQFSVYENYNNRKWIQSYYKTIYIDEDQSISDEFAYWLEENSNYVIPIPRLQPSFWETVSGFFSEALASGTAIVNWMTITPIALIPLALYCLIVIIAIIRRMIKG